MGLFIYSVILTLMTLLTTMQLLFTGFNPCIVLYVLCADVCVCVCVCVCFFFLTFRFNIYYYMLLYVFICIYMYFLYHILILETILLSSNELLTELLGLCLGLLCLYV